MIACFGRAVLSGTSLFCYHLVIDESRTHGELMFRLAESVTGVVVHEKVKSHLEEAGFDDLTSVDPAEWIG